MTETAEDRGFATAFQTIISRTLPPSAAKTPIFAELPEISAAIDQTNRENKIQKKLAAAKKCRRNAAHVLPSVLRNDSERLLKKVAIRGVVKLFNAVMECRKVLASGAESVVREKRAGRVKRNQKLKHARLEVDDAGKKTFFKILKKHRNDTTSAASGTAEFSGI